MKVRAISIFHGLLPPVRDLQASTLKFYLFTDRARSPWLRILDVECNELSQSCLHHAEWFDALMLIICYLCSGKVCLKSITIMLRSINPKTSKINELTDLSNGQHIRVLRASFNKKRQKKTEKTAQNCHLAHSWRGLVLTCREPGSVHGLIWFLNVYLSLNFWVKKFLILRGV